MALRLKATQSEVRQPYVGAHAMPDEDVDTHSQSQPPLPEPKALRELPEVRAV